MFEKSEQRQRDLEAIKNVVGDAKDGARFSWLELEQATGVKMDDRGKALLRQQLDRINRPYLSLHGDGIELSCPTNAEEIVGRHTLRLKNAFTSAKETTDVVMVRHGKELASDVLARLTHKQAMFATLDLTAELAKTTKKLPK
jgi:hypothetical protein